MRQKGILLLGQINDFLSTGAVGRNDLLDSHHPHPVLVRYFHAHHGSQSLEKDGTSARY